MHRPVRAMVLAAALLCLPAVPSPAHQSTDTAGRGTLSALFERSEAYDFDVPEPGSYALPAWKNAPDGKVLDANGRLSNLSATLDGRISLVSFVYLSCTDDQGCPLAMATLFDIHDASAAVPGLRDDVQLITISFDPERDTPDAIADFHHPAGHDMAGKQKLDWHIFTTRNRADLQPLLAGFGQAVDRSGDNETIQHLLRMFLVDRQGRIRNIYGLGMIDPRLLMTDVETLLIEERSQ